MASFCRSQRVLNAYWNACWNTTLYILLYCYLSGQITWILYRCYMYQHITKRDAYLSWLCTDDNKGVVVTRARWCPGVDVDFLTAGLMKHKKTTPLSLTNWTNTQTKTTYNIGYIVHTLLVYTLPMIHHCKYKKRSFIYSKECITFHWHCGSKKISTCLFIHYKIKLLHCNCSKLVKLSEF